MVDLDKLFAEAARYEANPEGELSLDALSGKAIKTLMESMAGAGSEDVRRKAAVDVLNLTKTNKSNAPVVTEEQLEYLGRVIVEAEAIRQSQLGGESGPRELESSSQN